MNDDHDLHGFEGVCRLFPLGGVVLFPHAVLPLHIFEPRYRQMTEDALASDGLIAIVQLASTGLASEENTEPRMENVACLGKILNHVRLPDGRFNFLLQGRRRICILEELNVNTLYRQARVELIDEIEPTNSQAFEKSELIRRYRAITEEVGGLSPDLDSVLTDALPLSVVADLLAQSMGFPASIKQEFLEEPRVARRVSTLLGLLQRICDEMGLGQVSPGSTSPPFSDN